MNHVVALAPRCRFVRPAGHGYSRKSPPRSAAKCPRSRHQVRTQAARPTSSASLKASGRLKAHGALFTTQAVFALWYIVGHAVLSENDPLTFALVREVASAGMLLALAQTFEGDLRVKSRGDLIDIAAVGALCYCTVIGFMFALSDLPEVQVAIAQPLVPALALGMSAVVGGEALSVVSGIGIACSIAGAVAFTVFNADGSGAGAGGHTWGYAALVVELLSYAGQMVMLPRVSSKYRPVTLTALYYSVASLATAATLVARERNDLSHLFASATPLAEPTTAAALAYAILGPTIFAFCAMSFSSSKVKPSTNASYITLQPILVAVLSLAMFGTALDSNECAAGAVVVAGLGLTIAGSPQLDRKWGAYVSDLPTNVPQTIATVADASAEAATSMADAGAEAAGVVKDAGMEVAGVVKDAGLEAVANVKESLAAVGSGSDGSSDEQRRGP